MKKNPSKKKGRKRFQREHVKIVSFSHWLLHRKPQKWIIRSFFWFSSFLSSQIIRMPISKEKQLPDHRGEFSRPIIAKSPFIAKIIFFPFLNWLRASGSEGASVCFLYFFAANPPQEMRSLFQMNHELSCTTMHNLASNAPPPLTTTMGHHAHPAAPHSNDMVETVSILMLTKHHCNISRLSDPKYW